MRYVITGAAVLLLALLAAGALTAAREPSSVDYARQQAELDRIAREEAAQAAAQPVRLALAPLWPLVPFVGAVGFLGFLGALGAAQVHRRWVERWPDSRGLLPVPLAQLPEVAPVALGAFHLAAVEEARRPIVPTAPHVYSPRIEYRGDGAPVAALQNSSSSPAPALPGVTDLLALGFRPSLETILLGLGEGGERITVTARALCHVALVGATGRGKSNLLRLLVPQLQAVGARVVLADPHFAPFDPESGEDWRPIAARLHLAPAVSADEIGVLLAYLGDELARRLELRRAGQKWGPPLFLALDELPVIADTVPGAADSLGRLLREGRKVGLFTVGAAQSFLVKVIGGDSSAREAYRTAFYVGGDLRSAAALLDVAQREIAEGALGGGVAYLRSAATAPARLVRVPYASNTAVAALLGASRAPSGPTSAPPSTGGDGAPVEGGAEGALEGAGAAPLPARQGAPEWTAEEARILEALRSGKTPGEVTEELAGSKGGRKYQLAAGRVAEVIRRALG